MKDAYFDWALLDLIRPRSTSFDLIKPLRTSSAYYENYP